MKKRVAPVEAVTDEEKTKTTLGFYEELKKSEPVSVTAVKPRTVLNKSTVIKQEKNTSVNAKAAPGEKVVCAESAPKAQKVTAAKSAAKKPEVKTVVPAPKSGEACRRKDGKYERDDHSSGIREGFGRCRCVGEKTQRQGVPRIQIHCHRA